VITIPALNRYLRQNVPYLYVSNAFEANHPSECAFTRLTGGYRPSAWTTKRKPSFQVVVRATQAAVADHTATAIYEHLHRRQEFFLDNTRVVTCLADQSSPIYVGKDENGRTLYSLNFTATTI